MQLPRFRGAVAPLSRASSAPPTDPPPRPVGSAWRGLLSRLVAVVALALAAALVGPAPTAQAAVGLTKVTDFGANPGQLNMYVYRPASLAAKPAVVFALHGCSQNAQMYADNSGLPELADRHGFLVVFAETTFSNHMNKCFNWYQTTDIRRGQGEAASIRQMAAHAVSAYGADAGRTYVTGLSAGGAMTSVMLAMYPDVFQAGAVVAGLPYGCAGDVMAALKCMDPGVDLTPDQWAKRVRDAHPSWSGPWPRVAVWHGDNDPTVVPLNADELRDQWTALHGLSQKPTRTSVIGPNSTRHEEYAAADGSVAVEVNRVPKIGHATPVDPGSGPQQCGSTGTANFQASICSSHWIAQFFGLDDSDPEGEVLPAPTGLTSTGVTDTTVDLSWDAVEGAEGYTVYRNGAPIGTADSTSYTDTGLAPGSSHTYAVAARDADGKRGRLSSTVTAQTTGATAICWTATNYAHVQAGRATASGGYTYAKGSQQNMGLYNMFVSHTLKESPAGHFTIADGTCS
ncbi:PHB depolymerase family esterase [Streptomyces sp. M2CJ-2]|uniref:extracellular catalytic domain type 1 short-chain-length polyhydroxyalkanoate depolymerase n=1 Tax=Streptomyces sp. M2CJ-2 TaxID=2803948 RepID=UPI0019260C98|nr:PHB depolymerase family esterase [Streptomyces sp. M2CJ-2]MBL3667692.1 PHB depolymerase family esterase [Streptomyces sp. M2CJ-2]